MQHSRRRRAASSADIIRAVGSRLKTATLLHIKPGRVWLMVQDEPFCEVESHDDGAHLTLRFSVHCAPQYAGSVVAWLFPLASEVAVSATTFLQANDGQALYGLAAERYWAKVRLARPLLSLVFVSQDEAH